MIVMYVHLVIPAMVLTVTRIVLVSVLVQPLMMIAGYVQRVIRVMVLTVTRIVMRYVSVTLS